MSGGPRPAELHALGVGALEICFNLVADHPPLILVVVDGLLVQQAAGFKVLDSVADRSVSNDDIEGRITPRIIPTL
jgi:hypothetical protein